MDVLPHSTKKPGCGDEILKYLRAQEETKDIKPCEIAVVGDRLFTDCLMANMIGAWGVYVRDGVVREKGFVSGEFSLYVVI